MFNSLPHNCSFEKAALAEPLSVLVHASRRAGLTPGQSVLVLGTGAIGILACALAKSMGASHVAAVDINESRLDFAKKNGFAQQVFCFPPADKPKNAEEQLRRAKDNASVALAAFGKEEGFDVVFECSGAESCIQMAIHVSIPSAHLYFLLALHARHLLLDPKFLLRPSVLRALLFLTLASPSPLPSSSPWIWSFHFSSDSLPSFTRNDLIPFLFFIQTATTGGKVMLIGMGTRNVMMPLSAAALREVDIHGSFRYANTYPTALALLSSGKLENIEKLVTHRFALKDTKKAFETLERGVDGDGRLVLKIMVGNSYAS